MNRRLILLVAAALGLGGFMVWSGEESLLGISLKQGKSLLGAATPAEPLAADASVSRTVPNPLGEVSIDMLNEIVDRPLFNPSRAPAEKAEPPAEPAPVVTAEPETVDDGINAEEFTLLAVASDGLETRAIVRSNASNEIFHLKEGEYLADLQVMAVGNRDITLGRNGQSVRLELFQKPAPGATPEAPEAAPPESEAPAGERSQPPPQ